MGHGAVAVTVRLLLTDAMKGFGERWLFSSYRRPKPRKALSWHWLSVVDTGRP